jgi:Cys-rich repeat protein
MKYQTKLIVAGLVLVALFYLYGGRRGYEPFQGTSAAEKVVKLRVKKCTVDSDCPSRFECKNEKCVDTRMP